MRRAERPEDCRVEGRARLLRFGDIGRAIIAVGIIALFPGCGGASTASTNGVSRGTAVEALEAAKEAASKASSVTIHATSRAEGSRLRLDLQLNRQSAKGSISVFGRQFEVTRVGQAFYVKGPASLYAQLGIHKQVPYGTWVKLPIRNGLAALTDLASEVTRTISTSGKVTKGSSLTVEGQPALELKTEGKLYKGRLYIKATGQPYPLRFEKTGQEVGQANFTHWDQPVTVSAPTQTTSAAG